MNKQEKLFLKQAAGPGEKAYEAVLTLKFLADPRLSFNDVAQRLFDLVGGDMKSMTMPTKRINTLLDLKVVDL
jgi:hypothetical protein